MPSISAFLLAIVVALALTPAPQSQKKLTPEMKMECGTVVSPEELKAEIARKAELARQNVAPQAIAPPTAAPYYLPLTIHMVHDSFSILGGLTPQQMDALMENLNRMWRPIGVQFFIYGEIDHSIHDDEFYFATTQEKQDALLRKNVVPNTINVYTANLGSKCGRGTFTWQPVNGVLLNDFCVSGGTPPELSGLEVFAHELGHYFDLLHTHEEGKGIGCPDGRDCKTTGDLVCDTPADPDLGSPLKVDHNCAYNDSVDPPAKCGANPRYTPLTNNLMSNSRGMCKNQFTPGQIQRVLQTFFNNSKRRSLIDKGTRYVDRLASASNTNCTYTAPCRTLATALQAANNGDFILLKWGSYAASAVGGKQVTLGRWGFENGVVIWP